MTSNSTRMNGFSIARTESLTSRRANYYLTSVGTDRLTGLPNRLAYLEALVPMEMQQAQRNGEPIGFMLLSADDMGVINEAHGRNAGDAILRDLAGYLQSIAKGEELLGHLDGTNFALLLYPADIEVGINQIATNCNSRK